MGTDAQHGERRRFWRLAAGLRRDRRQNDRQPEGAEVVRLIFHKYLQERKGCSTIARELREAGILSSKGNCLWSSATVTKILKNEKYCGDLIQKKTYTPDYLTHEKKYNHGKEPLVELKDHHEPIIDRETWQAVQRELSRRNRATGCGGHGNRYPLSGKIRCGECGKSFSHRTKKRQDGSSYYRWCCFTATNEGLRAHRRRRKVIVARRAADPG